MQTKDLKVGEIYAYRQRGHGRRARIMVLDTVTRYRSGQAPYGRTTEGTPRYKEAHPAEQTGSFGEDVYLLAATTTKGDTFKIEEGEAGTVADLRTITVAQALTERYGRPSTLPQGIRALLVKPRWIEGPYEEVVEAEAREAEIKASVEAMAKQRAREVAAEQHRRVDALEALGLPGEIYRAIVGRPSSYRSTEAWSAHHADRVTLSLEQVDALLSLIPEGARVPEPPAEVEDDGWTYAEGPTPEAVGSVHVPDEEPEEDQPAPEPKPKPVRKPNGTYSTTVYCSHREWEALGGEPTTSHVRLNFKAVTSSAMALARLMESRDRPDGQVNESNVKREYGQWQRFSGVPMAQPIEEDLEPEVLYIARAERGAPWFRYSDVADKVSRKSLYKA